jgi:hypothetical protein
LQDFLHGSLAGDPARVRMRVKICFGFVAGSLSWFPRLAACSRGFFVPSRRRRIVTAGRALRRPDPLEPQAYRRLPSAEQDERDSALQAALRRVDETVEQSQTLYAEGHDAAAVGLLKYVDLLLATLKSGVGSCRSGRRRLAGSPP